MNNEERASENSEKIFEIHNFMQVITNTFQYIEGVVYSWISCHNSGHVYPEEIRSGRAEGFCKLISDIEQRLCAKFNSKDKFEVCIKSNSFEDWNEIFYTALPRLREEILNNLQVSLRNIKSISNPMWSDLLPDIFAENVLPLFRQKQYLSSVRRACDLLRATIREKTGLYHLDGANLINEAYGKDSSFLVQILESHSKQNVQQGYADMFRGAMSAIRNVHYHGTEEISELEAARLIVLLGTLWVRAEGTTKI